MGTIIYLVGYNNQPAIKRGWGCGYVMIPKNHPFITYLEQSDDQWITHPSFEQEITYHKNKTVNGIDYLVIGFDTSHSYNDETHDFDYVFNETIKLQNAIDSIK